MRTHCITDHGQCPGPRPAASPAANAEPTEAPGANSDITIAADTVPSTGGVENSAAGEGADNMNTPDQPTTGAGSVNAGGPNSEDQGGTGIKGSAESKGATNKDRRQRSGDRRRLAQCGRPARLDLGQARASRTAPQRRWRDRPSTSKPDCIGSEACRSSALDLLNPRAGWS